MLATLTPLQDFEKSPCFLFLRSFCVTVIFAIFTKIAIFAISESRPFSLMLGLFPSCFEDKKNL